MVQDYLLETAGHLSHPTHRKGPLPIPWAAVYLPCTALLPASVPAAAPSAEKTQEPL